VCLRGLADLADAYLRDHTSAAVQTYVVFVPALGAEEEDVGPAMQFLDNRNVHYYWDPDGTVMGRYARTLAVDVKLWDFWTIYRPGSLWKPGRPPVPDFWRHQLSSLPRKSRLDVDEFVARIESMKSREQL